jgi:XisH protein
LSDKSSLVAAKDRFHQVVKTSLTKDGWNVTHDPLQIKVGGVDMEIDLGAERLLAAERGNEKIAVEVKSFLASASPIYQFHTALGQFINYRAALRREEPDRILYLAVPDLTYNSFFQLDFPASMLQENTVKLLIYDIQLEQIVQWKI